MSEILRTIDEIWRPIINYEGLYEISNYGRVKRFNKCKKCRIFKILKPNRVANGYLQITLLRNNIRKNYLIHRLVLEAFVGPCPLGKEGCHNDNNLENNFMGNLRWDTHKNNCYDKVKHGTKQEGIKNPNAVLKNDEIIEIRKLSNEDKLSQKEIGKLFNISQQHVSDIINKKRWKHVN